MHPIPSPTAHPPWGWSPVLLERGWLRWTCPSLPLVQGKAQDWACWARSPPEGEHHWTGTPGEAANLLTHDFREIHTEVNWRPIVAMRNVLVHDYIHISKEMLWETITRDIPELKTHIVRYYSECCENQ